MMLRCTSSEPPAMEVAGTKRAYLWNRPPSGASSSLSMPLGPMAAKPTSRSRRPISEPPSFKVDTSGPGWPPLAFALPRIAVQRWVLRMAASRARDWRSRGSADEPNCSIRRSHSSAAPPLMAKEKASMWAAWPVWYSATVMDRSALPKRLPPPPPNPGLEGSRSLDKVVMATRQPSPRAPRRSSSCTLASVKKTSLKAASPVISRNGRTSTPGWSMSIRK